jgi:hypothetical protein
VPERNAEGGQRQHSAADGMAQDSTRGNEEELDEAQRQEEALSHITVMLYQWDLPHLMCQLQKTKKRFQLRKGVSSFSSSEQASYDICQTFSRLMQKEESTANLIRRYREKPPGMPAFHILLLILGI